MAVTSERLAGMSRVITGNSNSEESQRREQRADYFAAEALELRRQRQEAQDRIRERDEAREADAVNHARHASGPATGAAAEQDNKQPAPEAAQEAAQAHEAARADQAPGQPERPLSEAERPAEIIYASPARSEPATQAAAREITDARQAESASAETVEITDSKAAKKAALAQMRAETEESIEQGQERGHGHGGPVATEPRVRFSHHRRCFGDRVVA